MSHPYPFHTAVAAFLLCLAAAPFASAAERTVTRWVDDNGETHFSDRAPPEAGSAFVPMQVDPDRNVVPAPPTPHFVPYRPPKTKRRTDRRAERAAAAKARRCTRDRAQLKRLHARLLAGYKARQYNGLMARKQRLEEREKEDCH